MPVEGALDEWCVVRGGGALAVTPLLPCLLLLPLAALLLWGRLWLCGR